MNGSHLLFELDRRDKLGVNRGGMCMRAPGVHLQSVCLMGELVDGILDGGSYQGEFPFHCKEIRWRLVEN